MLHKTCDMTLQLLGQVVDVAWVFVVGNKLRVEFLLKYHELIRAVFFFHIQGWQPIYPPFELSCYVTVLDKVWTETVPVIFVSFIGATLFVACFVLLCAPSCCYITHDTSSLSIHILTSFNIYTMVPLSALVSFCNYYFLTFFPEASSDLTDGHILVSAESTGLVLSISLFFLLFLVVLVWYILLLFRPFLYSLLISFYIPIIFCTSILMTPFFALNEHN